MRKVAKSRGGKCLSNQYINARKKLRWACDKGHEWEATPYSVKKGSWCRKCAGFDPVTIEEVKKIANDYGGRCLDKQVSSAYTLLSFICKDGHNFKRSGSQLRAGKWCIECAGGKGAAQRGTLESMQILAAARGGKFLSDKYYLANNKYKWQCSEGHIWTATAGSVSAGSWCAECAGCKRYTIETMQRKAAESGGKCLSKKYLGAREKLLWQCAEGHEWMAQASSVMNGQWCDKCADKKRAESRRKYSLKSADELAKKRGGRCIFKGEYKNTSQKLKWRCDKGHEWESSLGNILAGKWCAKCAGSARLSIDDMQRAAKKFGGACLSKRYKGVNHKYRWRCSHGHIFMMRGSCVRIHGRWCQTCRRNGRDSTKI